MEIDHKYTEEIVCPYCGRVFTDSWECADEDINLDCACGKKFEMQRNLVVTYSTARKQEDCQHENTYRHAEGWGHCENCNKYFEKGELPEATHNPLDKHFPDLEKQLDAIKIR